MDPARPFAVAGRAAPFRATERRLYSAPGTTTVACDRASAHGGVQKPSWPTVGSAPALLGAVAGSLALVTAHGQELDIVQSIGYFMPQLEPYGHFPLTRSLPFAVVIRPEQPVGEPGWCGSACSIWPT